MLCLNSRNMPNQSPNQAEYLRRIQPMADYLNRQLAQGRHQTVEGKMYGEK